MIKTLFAVLLICSSTTLVAQALSDEQKSQINKRLNTYIEYSKKENYEAIVDMAYPKVFEIATKEQLIEAFSGLELQGFVMDFEAMKVTSLKPVALSNAVNYVLCPYDMKMTLTMVNEEMKTPEMVENMLNAFKTVYSDGTVTFDEKNYKIRVEGSKYMMAVQDNEFGSDWYFSEFDQSNEMLLSMMYPEDVIAKAKNIIKD